MDKSDKKINVVCVKWGSKYSSEHVNRLYKMVKKNLTYNFNFYCLTEDITGCHPSVTQLPLENDGLVGWWNKLYLFKENFFGLEGTILYFDLDIIIVKSIDFLIEQDTEFLICKDWTSRDRDMWNSSIMKFDVGTLSHVWENFVKDRESIVAKYHGDQDWIYDCIPSAAIIDDTRVVSFKKSLNSRLPRFLMPLRALGGRFVWGWLFDMFDTLLPDSVAIVVFHGKPDPEDVAESTSGVWRRASFVNRCWK